MKTALKQIGLTVLAIWAGGLTLYLGKKFALTKSVAQKATEGYGV